MLLLDQYKTILASESPRRKDLLAMLTNNFTVEASGADERLPMGVGPGGAVILLAQRKARVVAEKNRDALVIAADTMVVIGHVVLGKPKDHMDAQRMLGLLSGHTHQVYTGVALSFQGREKSFHSITDVEMAAMSQEEINWYLSIGESMDKAGAYGIQGVASRFVRRISGDYFNVMGLPVNSLYENLTNFLPVK